MSWKNTLSKLIGPVLTVLATVIYHTLVVFGYAPQTAALLFPLVVLAAFVSGLRAGLVAAAWIGAYSFYAPPSDPLRSTVVLLSVVITAVMVGVLKRRSRIADETRHKADALDELNGNLERLLRVEKFVSDLITGWDALREEARRYNVEQIHSELASLASVTTGWRELWKEREALISEHEAKR